jgi:hypothetical protein
MNAHADELTQAAAQFRAWAAKGSVMLPASALHIYAAAMEEAAGALMRTQWKLHGGPPRRAPEPVQLSPDVMRQRLRVVGGREA